MRLNLDTLLKQAAALCHKRGARLTPQRAAVLQLIATQQKAASAYELLEQLQQIDPKAKPPTIYRALDFLLEQGLIHKVESTSSYVICHHLDEPNHISILLLCRSCQSTEEQSQPLLEQQLRAISQSAAFHYHHAVVELHGLCRECSSAKLNH